MANQQNIEKKLRADINQLKKRILELENKEQEYLKEIDFHKEFQEKYKQKLNEYQTIFETVPAAIWIAHDKNASVVSGNKIGTEILKLGKSDNLSKSSNEDKQTSHFKVYKNGIEIKPQDLPLQRAAKFGVSIRDYEEELIFESGEVRHLIGNAEPMVNEEGKTTGAVAAFIDITDFKKSELVRIQSQAINKAILDNSSIACILMTTNLRIIEFNKKAGNDIFQYLNLNLKKNSYIDEYIDITQRLNDAFGKVIDGEKTTFEKDIDHDGQKFWFNISIDPFYMNDKITGIVFSFEDITVRKIAENKLKDNEYLLRKVINILPVGLLVTDITGNLIYANKISEQILEIPIDILQKRKLIGEDWNIIHQDGTHLDHNNYPAYKALYENRMIFDFVMGYKLNNSIKWLNVSAAPIGIDEYGVVLVFQDISKEFNSQ